MSLSSVEWTFGECWGLLMGAGMVVYCRQIARFAEANDGSGRYESGMYPRSERRLVAFLTVLNLVVGLAIGTVALLGLLDVLPRPS